MTEKKKNKTLEAIRKLRAKLSAEKQGVASLPNDADGTISTHLQILSKKRQEEQS